MPDLTPLYTGETGELSATYRPATTPPGYTTARGTQGHFLASPGGPSTRFILYRWDMSATSGGPGPHFHRTYDEAFIVLSAIRTGIGTAIGLYRRMKGPSRGGARGAGLSARRRRRRSHDGAR